VVSAAELEALRAGGDDVLIVDVRWYLDGGCGRDAYEAAHIPGAVFVDLEAVLAASPGDGPGRHPLQRPEVFAAGMAAAGASDDTFVVAYDDASGSIAARLWWMLTVTGHTAAVLDGGIAAWPGEVERGAGTGTPRPAGTFTPRPWPAGRVVRADDVARFIDGGGVVVDARAPERYRGDVEPVDPRAGHIPGACSAPWMTNLDASGRLRPADELRADYEALGVRDGSPVIAYCGSGVTACFDILAMTVAGFDDVRLYEGSWSDWSSEPARPVATGND